MFKLKVNSIQYEYVAGVKSNDHNKIKQPVNHISSRVNYYLIHYLDMVGNQNKAIAVIYLQTKMFPEFKLRNELICELAYLVEGNTVDKWVGRSIYNQMEWVTTIS